MIRTNRVSHPPLPKKKTCILVNRLWQRRSWNEGARVIPTYCAKDTEHTITTVFHQSLEEKVA